jgi:hypothetical protein
MPQPPSISGVPSQGPNFDPMDRIIQDLMNIESFLIQLDPKDLKAFNAQYPKITPIRKTNAGQIDLLFDDPYNYPHSRLQALHKENEAIFLNLEGLAGSMNPLNETEFKRFLHVVEQALSKFDDELTP